MATLSARPSIVPATAAIATGAGLLASGVVLAIIGSLTVAGGFLAASIVLGAGMLLLRRTGAEPEQDGAELDWTMLRALASASADAIAITDRAGRLVCANDRYEQLFAGIPNPPTLPVGEAGIAALSAAGRAAWRDGHGHAARVTVRGSALSADVTQIGNLEQVLLWRFRGAEGFDLVETSETLIAGTTGDRLGAAGIMAVLVSPEGRVRAANRVFRTRARGREESAVAGAEFARLLVTDTAGLVRFEREGSTGNPLRIVQVPFLEGGEAPMLVVLLDEEEAPAAPVVADSGQFATLLSLMPFGLALVDRDGRFLDMNQAFARAAEVDRAAPPLYPGDLVVRDDKQALADAIRRLASGAQTAADLAVRLANHPDEPVALSIVGARGIGQAAVLLALKDNSTDNRLQREVAQVTKMQAVGQLAGGVAHDFNNILTAILGHCDLMLMRHAPGDSDYDDIQQIRANSNRAASLTRQLLAFSRQQTLRPQVLQLPDVVSEVSTLLKRLLGETVKLEVRHGRNLGPVRADPGQLEQVVVNLAVNARDAMLAENPMAGGTLTIQTQAVPAAEVRAMRSDIMPVADYTALIVSDTGSGIPQELLPKIFEPFFTTKEIGKGTGLGLSTVYGIVKQSGGYIFAESKPGEGATFSIYLPVHAAVERGTTLKRPAAPREGSTNLWGSGTILLVEDEDMVRAVAERALKRQGYSVVTAENGEAALELLAEGERPDLLITDVVMPMMDGPTMVRHARKRYPDLPILFMSGYAEEQLRKSIDLDNVAFLPKPFSIQQLAEAARDVLAR